jgi:predicted enzyme related to lactoylglutathione lyase
MGPTYAFAKLPAQDSDRARRFYEETFGLRPYAEYFGHFYYQVNGTRFVIFPSSGAPSGTHDQMGFVVDDLDVEMKALRSKGVVFEEYPGLTENGLVVDGPGKAAWLKDSEGNLLSLAEKPPIMTLAPADLET